MWRSIRAFPRLIISPGSRRTLAALDVAWIFFAFFITLPSVGSILVAPHVATSMIVFVGLFVFALVCRSYTEAQAAAVSGSLKIAMGSCLFAAAKLVTDANPVAIVVSLSWAALLAICLVFGIRKDGTCSVIVVRVIARTMLTTLIFVLLSLAIVVALYLLLPTSVWSTYFVLGGDVAIVKPFGAAVPLCALPPMWLELRRLSRVTANSQGHALGWATSFAVILWFAAGWFGIGADVVRRSDLAEVSRSQYFELASAVFGVMFASVFSICAIVFSNRTLSRLRRSLAVVLAWCVVSFVVMGFSDFVFLKVDDFGVLALLYGPLLLCYLVALHISRGVFTRLMRSLDIMRQCHHNPST